LTGGRKQSLLLATVTAAPLKVQYWQQTTVPIYNCASNTPIKITLNFSRLVFVLIRILMLNVTNTMEYMTLTL